ARSLNSSAAALNDAAHAILTTDTSVKVSTREIQLDGNPVGVTGFAKGAAMIGPNMATLLAFVLTDAPVAMDDLSRVVGRAADQSFNCVSVEGHTSTNDTLLLLANGDGANLQGNSLARYEQSVTSVCADLAREIAADAEGASHLVVLDVEGM